MAEIRTERKKGGHAWMWVVLAVIVLITAVLLLAWTGYVELPFQVSADALAPADGQQVAAGYVPMSVEG